MIVSPKICGFVPPKLSICSNPPLGLLLSPTSTKWTSSLGTPRAASCGIASAEITELPE